MRRLLIPTSLLWLGCADVIAVADGGVPPDGPDAGLPPVVDARPMPPDGPDPAVDAALDAAPDAEPDFGPCVTPVEEVCNGRDDDCDGASDEGAVCCRQNPELCNGADDDCDGRIDEGAECCEPAEEVCNGADDDCDGGADEGLDCCAGVDEVCNGADDDCDGEADEGLDCCAGDDEVCNGEDDDCDGSVDEGLDCCMGADELCNGADDDCDAAVDEGGVCGLFVEQNCRLFWAWADERLGPANASASWGPCPGIDRFGNGDIGCTGTRFDGNFARISFQGDVNDDDQFGFALLCRPGDDAALAAWVQSQCALFVGYADNNRAPNGGPVFAGCPQAIETRAGDLRCTSTGYDGRFRPLYTQGDVDDNDDLSFAWICNEDPARPGLANSVQRQVEVFAGWADERRGPVDGSATWSTCPQMHSQQAGDVRCVGTQGDGQFHKLNLIGDVNGDDQAGIAIRAAR